MGRRMKVYSLNEEDYISLEDACDQLFDYDGVCVGDVKELWEGDGTRYKASDFLPDILEIIAEKAWYIAGDIGEDWPENNVSQAFELESDIKKLVDSWAGKYNLQPSFYGVKNERKIKVKINSFDGDYEIIECNL